MYTVYIHVYTCNGHDHGSAGEYHAVGRAQVAQRVARIPEVEVVPGEEAGCEIRVSDHCLD